MVALTRYQGSCRRERRNPLPLSEQGLCSFATTLAVEGLACATIKAYLAGVWHAQVERGWPEPHWGSMPRLGQVLKGIRRERSPVSPELLLQPHDGWQKKPSFGSTMLSAVVVYLVSRKDAPGPLF